MTTQYTIQKRIVCGNASGSWQVINSALEIDLVIDFLSEFDEFNHNTLSAKTIRMGCIHQYRAEPME